MISGHCSKTHKGKACAKHRARQQDKRKALYLQGFSENGRLLNSGSPREEYGALPQNVESMLQMVLGLSGESVRRTNACTGGDTAIERVELVRGLKQPVA